MKKNLVSCRYSFLLVFLFLGNIISVSAQTEPVKKVDRSKINPTIITIKKPIANQTVDIKQPIPHFKNISPITLNTINEVVERTNLKPVAQMPPKKLNIIPSTVNGILTPRDPYLNSMAYLEILNGNSLTGDNLVECACRNSKVTWVRLVLRVTAGKDYMITSMISPQSGNSIKLDFTSNEFVHEAVINSKKQEVKIILSPQSTGMIYFYLRCSEPTITNNNWTFHSMAVQEVN